MLPFTQTPFDGTIDGHPDLTELFKLVMNARDVIVADSPEHDPPFVYITSGSDHSNHFRFTKTADGYTLQKEVRSKD